MVAYPGTHAMERIPTDIRLSVKSSPRGARAGRRRPRARWRRGAASGNPRKGHDDNIKDPKALALGKNALPIAAA